MCVLKRLLWVDCTAGAIVGVVVITFTGWLSQLEGLPRKVLLFTGVVNLLYACCSFSLAIQAERPMLLIKLLVFANLTWVPVCMVLVMFFWEQASPIGFAHLVCEAIFVGGLAVLEWNQRDQLLTRA